MNEWDKKRDIMLRYDSSARTYDRQYAEEQATKIEAALNTISIKKNSLVLDVGCGTGLLFSYVAGKAEATVGLDISQKILLQAEKRAKFLPNTHLIFADADKMPLKENSFDYVFAFTLIQNMPNPVKTLNETKRVAKKDAVIVVTGLKKTFTIKSFEDLLRDAGLKVVALKDKNLKCHVAICTKFS